MRNLINHFIRNRLTLSDKKYLVMLGVHGIRHQYAAHYYTHCTDCTYMTFQEWKEHIHKRNGE